MGKGHRDNARARRKRGAAAYSKKHARRSPAPKRAMRCTVCGRESRVAKLCCARCGALLHRTDQHVRCPNCGPMDSGICPRCLPASR